jgi:hypothetical protein
MSDTEIDLKREEDERLDTAEDPNEEVRTITITCLRTRKAAQTRYLYITPSLRPLTASLYTARHGADSGPGRDLRDEATRPGDGRGGRQAPRDAAIPRHRTARDARKQGGRGCATTAQAQKKSRHTSRASAASTA